MSSTKIGNINLLGFLTLKDKKYSVSQLINKLETDVNNVDTLLFKVPQLTENQCVHLNIEFNTDETFSDLATSQTFSSKTHPELFKVFTGLGVDDFPESGIEFSISKEQVLFDITAVTNPTYFRFQWLVGDKLDPAKEFEAKNYGFGKVSGLMNVFDEYVPTKLSELVNDANYLTIDGNAATATKLASAKTISLSGAITGSASFDGSNNVDIVTALDNITINAEDIEGLSISWNDLTDKPSIPSNYSDLTNDTGLVLSDVNFSNTLNTKLSGIETGAQVNVIESIKVDGTVLTVSNKSVDIDLSGKANVGDIPENSDFTLAGLSERSYNSLTDKPTIPSKYSDLTNDTGKVLSDVNFSTSLNTKLSGIEAGAEINKIESITVDGTPLTITNKSVDIDLSGKADVDNIPVNSDFTLAGLSEKSYNSLTDKPTIPSKYSDLTNDTGKYLSTNDYTDSDKTKLNGIEAGAQVNIIESIKVDGTTLTVSNKSVNIDLSGKADVDDIPENVSELTNDVGYITVDSNINGNAATATKLASAKTISLSGAITGSVSFDGSNNVDIVTALDNITINAEDIEGLSVSWNDLTDKPIIPNNNSFTLAGLSEKSYNSLTDKPDLSKKADLVNGVIPATQLPSYVDDVIECYVDIVTNKIYKESTKSTEITPESGKVYIDLNTNLQYRWGGTTLVGISSSLALGETSDTAFAGNRGKALEVAILSKADVDDLPSKYSDLTNDTGLVLSEVNFSSTLNTKLSGIEAGAQVNVIEAITVNGSSASTTITNKVANIDINTIDTLLFKVPQLTNDQFVHFKIEFNDDPQFEATNGVIISTQNDSNKFKIFTGLAVEDFPSSGITYTLSREQLLLDLTNFNSNLPNNFRFQWLVGDVNNLNQQLVAGAYGFGKVSGLMNVFDEYIPTKMSDLTNDLDYVTSSGNIATATKLASAKTISLSGAITGSASFDGSNNIDIVTALDNITINAEDIEGLSVSWNDLTDKPTIPSKYGELTNDTGKVLSDVNFSTSLNTKLAGIETGAQVNIIESITVDGTPLTISNKSVNINLSGKADISDIPANSDFTLAGLSERSYNSLTDKPTIPSKYSDLTNDTGLVLSDVNFTNTLNTKLSGIEAGAEVNIIESIKVDGTTLTVSNKSVDIDLSGKADVDDIPENSDFTLAGLSERSYNSLTDKPTIPSKYSDLTNDTGKYLSDVNFSSTLNTKLTGIEAGAQVNKIENITVNGKSVNINNKTVDIDANSINTLLFKVPILTDEQFAHLSIEFCADSQFETTSIQKFTSNVNTNLFKIFTGLVTDDFPSSGITYTVSREQVLFNLDSINSDLNYFRFQWLIGTIGDVGQTLSPSNYGFGMISGLTNVFDEYIPTKISELDNDVSYITVDSDINGNAATATKLASAKTISLSGAITGSVSFDGSNNVDIVTALNNITINAEDIEGLSVSWNDLTDKPTIPSKYSELTNDTGKVLSDVNFSNTLNTKLGGIEAGAEVNVIESIKVDGTTLAISNKSVNINLNGKANVSDIPVNSDFTLAGLSEKSYNSLTDKPSIPSKYSDLTNDTGKYLSDVNFSTSLNTKLSGIEAGAEVNIIDSVKINGTALTVSNKSVNIDLSDYATLDVGTWTIDSVNNTPNTTLYVSQSNGNNQLLVKTNNGYIPISGTSNNSNVSSTEYLTFKVPQLTADQFVHLLVEFSEDGVNFSNSEVINTFSGVGDIGTKSIIVSTGLGFIDFPTTGLSVQFNGESLIVPIPTQTLNNIQSNNSVVYFRFKWLVGTIDDTTTVTDDGRYGFGVVSGLNVIFDDKCLCEGVAGLETMSLDNSVAPISGDYIVSIDSKHNTIYTHTLIGGEIFEFVEPGNTVSFRLYLTTPTTSVSFTLPTNIIWESEPNFTTTNALYMLVFEWNPILNKWLGNQMWEPVVLGE